MDSGKKMKADKILAEDCQKVFEKDAQDLTNKYSKKIEEAAVAKEADLIKVNCRNLLLGVKAVERAGSRPEAGA